MSARVLDRPETGYWAMRLVRNGPEVAACIQWEQTTHEPGLPENKMDRSPILTARLGGEIVAVDRVWLSRGRPITKAEHDYMVAVANWAKQHSPSEPIANPRAPVDLSTMALPF